MARTIPAALLSAITARECQPFFAFEALLDGGAIRIWTGQGTKTIDGDDYTGGGALIGMGEISEIIDLTAQSVTVTLSGLASGTLSAALAEPYQGRVANIYLGERSTSEVLLAFSGYLDTMSPADDGSTASITVTIESKLVDLQRPRLRRYTKESQKALFPGDTFFDWTADLADKQVPWGRDLD
jgi:hypothetical protein